MTHDKSYLCFNNFDENHNSSLNIFMEEVLTFTNSNNYTIALTFLELNNIFNNLNSINSYYIRKPNSLVILRIHATKLLLMDFNYKPNNTIFELFNIHYDLTRLFYIKFVQNNSAIEYDIHETLLSAGYHGPLPVTNLDEVFMNYIHITVKHIY